MSQQCKQCGGVLRDSGDCDACLMRLGLSQTEEGQSDSAYVTKLPSIEELNHQFPQLKINRLIGRGGMGAIYHARQTALDRDVALKIIAREISRDTNFLDRFEREAKTLARLSHPNIVTVFDFGHTLDGQAYLLMEFVDGINLREAMQSQSLVAQDVPNLMIKICDALQYAHDKGVVHRDVKPENILLGEDGAIKVADFGIAKIVDDKTPTLTATRQVLGSLNYLAPEHLESPSKVDHRVDLYAVGVMMYELLTGRLPIGRFESPHVLDPTVSPQLDAIVLGALERDPNKRYQSAKELSQALHCVSSGAATAPSSGRASTSITVPFKTEYLGGLAEAVGLAQFRSDCIAIEYRIRDAVFMGALKTKTAVVEIPIDNIASLDLEEGWFTHKLVLVADSILVLKDLPKAESGRFEMRIAQTELGLARKAVQWLKVRDSERPSFAAQVNRMFASLQVHRDSRWVTLSAFFLICAAVNAGLLAILIVIFANKFDSAEQVVLIVASAVLIAPVAILQLVTAIMCMKGQPRGLATTTSIISLLPICPAWFLSCPVGVWSLRWLLELGQQGQAPPSTQSWTSTTVLFIRESKWAKVVAAANIAALGVALLAFGAWQGGYMPSQVQFRIVRGDIDPTQLTRAVESRIPGGSPVSVVADRLTIYARHKDRAAIAQSLAIELPIELCVISGSESRQPKLGQRVSESPSEPNRTLELQSQMVSSVGAMTLRELAIELTQVGRQALERLRFTEGSDNRLVLVVDGIVEGLAEPQDYVGKQLKFQLSDSSELSTRSLISAIRGPSLGTDLELLD